MSFIELLILHGNKQNGKTEKLKKFLSEVQSELDVENSGGGTATQRENWNIFQTNIKLIFNSIVLHLTIYQ